MSTKPIRSFTELVALLNKGKFAGKVNEHLTHALETLDALPDGQGTATLTVTLTVSYQEGRIDVKPAVKSKLPEEKGFGATPFWSHEGGFSVTHPSQLDMLAGPRDASRPGESARDAG